MSTLISSASPESFAETQSPSWRADAKDPSTPSARLFEAGVRSRSLTIFLLLIVGGIFGTRPGIRPWSVEAARRADRTGGHDRAPTDWHLRVAIPLPETTAEQHNVFLRQRVTEFTASAAVLARRVRFLLPFA